MKNPKATEINRSPWCSCA